MDTEKRVHIQDVKPYFVPDTLDDLHGPSEGNIELPIHVY